MNRKKKATTPNGKAETNGPKSFRRISMEIHRHKLKGTLKYFDSSKGSGFITPDSGEDDQIFNHSSVKSACPWIKAFDITGPSDFPAKDESPICAEKRNLADLPRDVLLLIFEKIAAFWIIRSAQFVCRSWLLLSYDPKLWMRIDMTGHTDILSLLYMDRTAMEAVDRSRGGLEELYIENFGNDVLLRYVVGRTTRLRRLCLTSSFLISENILVQTVSRCPQLEALEISLCSFSSELFALIGQACPQLKEFKLFQRRWALLRGAEFERDRQALAIADHMRQLRRLELHGNPITAIGLLAILENCPDLERLDIRQCFELQLDETLKEKCARIRDFRFCNDR